MDIIPSSLLPYKVTINLDKLMRSIVENNGWVSDILLVDSILAWIAENIPPSSMLCGIKAIMTVTEKRESRSYPLFDDFDTNFFKNSSDSNYILFSFVNEEDALMFRINFSDALD